MTIARDSVFVQDRVEQLREPVGFTVADGRLVEGSGLPIEPGTRVFLADGEYTTGAFEFDPEGAESVVTKLADGPTELDRVWRLRPQYYELFMQDYHRSIERLDPEPLRLFGLLAVTAGVALVWLARS